MNIYLTDKNFKKENICFYKLYKSNKGNKINGLNNNNIHQHQHHHNSQYKNNNSYKINYITNNIALNGLYLKLDFNSLEFTKYDDKYRLTFSIQQNKELINMIKETEQYILEKINTNKNIQFNIYEKLKNGYIDITLNDLNNSIIYKKNSFNNYSTNEQISQSFSQYNYKDYSSVQQNKNMTCSKNIKVDDNISSCTESNEIPDQSKNLVITLNEKTSYIILKMFSIWETSSEIGITHKFEQPTLFNLF